MSILTHLNQQGEAHMVDVSEKAETSRTAIAESKVSLNAELFSALKSDAIPKGDVLATARIAGIQAAKKCADLIPLCHPLPLSKVTIDIELEDFDTELKASIVKITSTCKTTGKTGVEMEALTAASVSALTIYDMCKAIDKGMEIGPTRLLSKTGGKSGDWSTS